MAGQIIIISGSAGTGKTTTCNTFADRADDSYFMFGFDLFSCMMPATYTTFGKRAKEGIFHYRDEPDNPESQLKTGFGPLGWRALKAFHEMIAAASRAGQNIVVDHQLLAIDPPVLQQCIWCLRDLPVFFVGLKPPKDVCHDRIANRERDYPETMVRELGEGAVERMVQELHEITPWYYEINNQHDYYDLICDTSAMNPEEICEQIEASLAQGPGTAFETLRERYPENKT